MKIVLLSASIPLWLDVLAALLSVYLFFVCLKHGLMRRHEQRALYLLGAFVIVPLLALTHFLWRWDLTSPAVYSPADHWWLIAIGPGEDGGARTFNLILGGLICCLLYLGATVLVWFLSWYYRLKKGYHLLAIHRLLGKLLVIFVGLMIYLKIQGINLTPLWVGMGAASILVGIALQEPLASLFTGVALDVEGVFRRGEWIRIGDGGLVGKVVEKNWRTTRLMTIDDELVTIPNRKLGSETVINYNQPDAAHAHLLYVGTSYKDPPVKVKEILRSILMREPRIARNPPPRVRTIRYNDFSIDYQLKFWIRNYDQHPSIYDAIMSQVWYAFKFYGVEIPFPIRTVHMKEQPHLKEEAQRIREGGESIRTFLESLPCFQRHLHTRDLDYLGWNAFQRRYGPGEHVIQKEEMGDALYLLREGGCRVALPGGEGREITPGSYFGEMGLMGSPIRTADVIAGSDGCTTVRIDRECMQVLFKRYPRLRDEFELVREQRMEDAGLEMRVGLEEAIPLKTRLLRGLKEIIIPW